jgi:hypothetical protein
MGTFYQSDGNGNFNFITSVKLKNLLLQLNPFAKSQKIFLFHFDFEARAKHTSGYFIRNPCYYPLLFLYEYSFSYRRYLPLETEI